MSVAGLGCHIQQAELPALTSVRARTFPCRSTTFHPHTHTLRRTAYHTASASLTY